MSYPKYVVTYCVMTTEAGSNPFWHSLIVMSEQVDENAPIEVKHAFGFYSTYPSSTTNPIIKFLKELLGFKIDLQESHGHLEKEKLRYMDGQGLRGLSFDVTEDKYKALHQAYEDARRLEQEAIDEYKEHLDKEGIPVNGHTRWMKERQLTGEGTRERRLFPFHIDWGFSWNFNDFGFFTNQSYTCKSRALDLLRTVDIIDDDFRQNILGAPAVHAFPRFSSLPLPPIQFVSTGARTEEKARSKVYHNRSWGNNRLFWAHTPRMHGIRMTDDELQKQEDEYQLIRNMSQQIDEVELLLLNKIDDYQKDGNSKGKHLQQCRTQLQRVIQVKESLKATNSNQHKSSLTSRLFFVQKTLNTARITLTPEKLNYNFLDRAIENIALRDALLGLAAIIAVINLLTGVTAVAAAVAAGMYSTYSFYKAIETELEMATMLNDYHEFHAPKPA